MNKIITLADFDLTNYSHTISFCSEKIASTLIVHKDSIEDITVEVSIDGNDNDAYVGEFYYRHLLSVRLLMDTGSLFVIKIHYDDLDEMIADKINLEQFLDEAFEVNTELNGDNNSEAENE